MEYFKYLIFKKFYLIKQNIDVNYYLNYDSIDISIIIIFDTNI